MCKATESVTYAAIETLSGVGELFLGIDSLNWEIVLYYVQV